MIDLKTLRSEHGLTQQDLADQIHCVRTVIANIECGIQRPSVDTAKAIGKVLNCKWWEFFEEGCDAGGSDSLYGPGSGKTSKN